MANRNLDEMTLEEIHLNAFVLFRMGYKTYKKRSTYIESLYKENKDFSIDQLAYFALV